MITSAAQYHGIHPKRIIFADRVPKELHIERHSAADIFLDSFIYGAHSTATDALRGVKNFKCSISCIITLFACHRVFQC